MLDDGHLGITADALDQALAAARDDHVHIFGQRDELAHHLAVGGLHQLHGVVRQTGLSQRLLHQPGQGFVGVNGFGAAAQDARVAAFDGQTGGLDGDIGPALVNHAEHANGHPHLAHADSAGLLLHADDLANHVGHGGQLLAALGTGIQHFGCELEAIHQRLGQASRAGPRQVACVVRLQSVCAFAQQPGQSHKRFVFHSCWRL